MDKCIGDTKESNSQRNQNRLPGQNQREEN